MQDSLNESSVRPNGTPVMSLLRSRKTQKFLKFFFLRFSREHSQEGGREHSLDGGREHSLDGGREHSLPVVTGCWSSTLQPTSGPDRLSEKPRPARSG